MNATDSRYDPRNTPLLPPPPGVKPNFQNPQTRAPQAHITVSVCSVLSVIFVVLRVHRRLRLSRSWGLDDCTCVFHRHGHHRCRILHFCHTYLSADSALPLSLITCSTQRRLSDMLFLGVEVSISVLSIITVMLKLDAYNCSPYLLRCPFCSKCR